MHAVESNNTDMVHFLIEVMMVCGQGGSSGGRVVTQLSLISLGFLFPAYNVFRACFSFYLKNKTSKGFDYYTQS